VDLLDGLKRSGAETHLEWRPVGIDNRQVVYLHPCTLALSPVRSDGCRHSRQANRPGHCITAPSRRQSRPLPMSIGPNPPFLLGDRSEPALSPRRSIRTCQLRRAGRDRSCGGGGQVRTDGGKAEDRLGPIGGLVGGQVRTDGGKAEDRLGPIGGLVGGRSAGRGEGGWRRLGRTGWEVDPDCSRARTGHLSCQRRSEG
jgi:hypothetical protein